MQQPSIAALKQLRDEKRTKSKQGGPAPPPPRETFNLKAGVKAADVTAMLSAAWKLRSADKTSVLLWVDPSAPLLVPF